MDAEISTLETKLANQIEERYKKGRAYVDKLTQSILAKAFRGELVPQDPNDEPASEFLKRIKETRADGDKISTGYDDEMCEISYATEEIVSEMIVCGVSKAINIRKCPSKSILRVL